MEQPLTPQQNPVLPNLIGGLGNQLFIASAAYVVGKLHNSPVYLCNESENAHNVSKHDYRDSVLKEFGIKLNSKISSIKCLGINEYWHNDFMPWNPQEISVPVILRGYYQHITHIEMFEDEINGKYEGVTAGGITKDVKKTTDFIIPKDLNDNNEITIKKWTKVQKILDDELDRNINGKDQIIYHRQIIYLEKHQLNM